MRSALFLHDGSRWPYAIFDILGRQPSPLGPAWPELRRGHMSLIYHAREAAALISDRSITGIS
jgi:hypothetical protein